jgi:hypothetical protein
MVHFFRIKETGSVKNPTFTAVVVSFILWIITGILLRGSIIWATAFMIAEYVAAAVIFSKPLRLPIQKILYATRYPRIIGGSPSKASVKWIHANREMLRRANVSIFHGRGAIVREKLHKVHQGSFTNQVDIKTDGREALWSKDEPSDRA